MGLCRIKPDKSCLEIQYKALRRKLAKGKETSKQKDYQIRSFQELKSKYRDIQSVSDPVSTSSLLIKQFVDNKAMEESIVSGIMDAMSDRKKLHSHIKNYVTSKDFLQQLLSIYQSFHKTI
jgi:protein subunit release factor A